MPSQGSPCFTTIKNHNTLKQSAEGYHCSGSFTTIKNHNTLKRDTGMITPSDGFTTIKNHNTLKPMGSNCSEV